MIAAIQVPPSDTPPLPGTTARPVQSVPEQPFFVVPFAEHHLIDRLPAWLHRIETAVWINRGTGQHLRPNTVAMLLRTRGQNARLSPSVEQLHPWTGLRLTFATANERHAFARAWRELRNAPAVAAA